ncbi:phosphoenolpyruvate--protein phosphotransferase [Marinomonas mediterranea]|jgi:phosphoenolpyruvate-protein phosphotransferase|uniref:phosphoenolpyruvate--protein phosphotransferase n=1 Tax=Marinomonas mediterranea (strain ATCC 700492 / JCM 21426 / NBRC 103028 / MMB-1) TaxID=717774 RepID=F2K1Z8_MARM1|nr:phosphoenolpyruvate--protein phosphotransferase [Marinomonas mediterranea]ADZ89992.1 PTSINtr with GAF domain, PtsP [Marinomonas mediterranea MMB-1]WCN16200.1 phosphoenolpyruvate--protein phosphotransferase [Marinomonas mediterranea MMB-1]
MLSLLRRITQEVTAAQTLPSALDIIVRRVRRAMRSEVCSIYLVDPNTEEYVLMATRGLNSGGAGKLSLKAHEGLVSLVGRRAEPVNLEDAHAHPSFHYLSGSGEERYKSFLGVPIIHHRQILGVLVVQHEDKRRFDEGEEAFLITLSAQLAGVIAHAEATGAMTTLDNTEKPTSQDFRYKGIAGSQGVAIGKGMVVYPPADLDVIPDRKTQEIESELSSFSDALKAVRKDIRRASSRLSQHLSEDEKALFDVYLKILDDNALAAEVEHRIKEGNWAQGALRQVVQFHISHFNRMEDPYLRERATDIRDLGRRILSHLQETAPSPTETFKEPVILIGEELTASMLGEVPIDKVIGLVSVMGSSNSHVAILARAMGIPTVMGALDVPYTQLDKVDMIVDGYSGQIFTNPSDHLTENYQQIVDEERQLETEFEALKDLPCETKDGKRLSLFVNTGLSADIARSLDRGAEGIGLYRTEVPFMVRDRFPTEAEQEVIYRQQLEGFAPAPVTVRTLDVGGDKALPYFPIKEENPFLGWRGIRVTLDHLEIFMAQIRAMIKASAGLHNLKIMLPMISNVSEVEEAIVLIQRAYDEVLEEGYDVKMPKVGVMIEVPAAVYQVKELAALVDFMSVGSNDLTQYLLAVDRNNPRVADLYHSFHPAVLRALQSIVTEAKDEHVTLSVCGEMAGDPMGAILFMAMGYDVLSMSSTSLPKVKAVIRHITMEQAENMLSEVLNLSRASAVKKTMEGLMRDANIERFVRPAKSSSMNQ